jgi:hypothetical protein
MKRYYDMRAETVIRRAPYSSVHKEHAQMIGCDPKLISGYVVVDRYGDKVWPHFIDVAPKPASDKVTEELNLIAAKLLMEQECGKE